MNNEDCSSSSSSTEENDPVYVGKRDHNGRPHGRGTLTYPDTGTTFRGHFHHGNKEGSGCFYFDDSSSLSGKFKNDNLEGWGVYTYPEGSQMIGEYKSGILNGSFTEMSACGDITVKGAHKNNVRTGLLQIFEEDNSVLIGVVDEDGQLTGDNIAYVYPDGETALLGSFNAGKLIEGRYASLTSSLPASTFPEFTLNQHLTSVVLCEESTHDVISNYPLLPDAFEQRTVYVHKSLVPGAGEGLFALRSLCCGEVASFYNGTRLTHEEVDNRDWSLNSNTISLNENTVLDVPQQFSCVSQYCATLGHKVNHSSLPNCEYAPYSHPRFGDIKCVRAIKSIEANEELTCNYGYVHKQLNSEEDDLPEWFVQEGALIKAQKDINITACKNGLAT